MADSPLPHAPVALTEGQRNLLESFEAFLDGRDRVLLVRGPAGTGKTHMIREFLRLMRVRNRRFTLSAPTGRAAKVLADKTGHEASTVHRVIYNLDEVREHQDSDAEESETFKLYFDLRVPMEGDHHVLIVDEASMVSDVVENGEFVRFGSGRLLKDLVRHVNHDANDHRRKLVMVGDPYQLPPIGMNLSPALDPECLRQHLGVDPVVVELAEVLRQAEGGILAHATRLRAALAAGTFAELNLHPIPPQVREPSREELEAILAGAEIPDTMFVAHSNEQVRRHNLHARERRHPDSPDHPQPGEPMLVVRNNPALGLLNGERVELVEALPDVRRRTITLRRRVDGRIESFPVELAFRGVRILVRTPSGPVLHETWCNDTLLWSADREPSSDEWKALYIDFKMRRPEVCPGTKAFTDALMKDRYFNCLQLKFGYAATCHKAQGGEWERVVVDCEGRHTLNAETFRWLYTAITRAKSELLLLSPPRFGRLDALKGALHSSEAERPSDVPPLLLEHIRSLGLKVESAASHPYAWNLRLRRGDTSAGIRVTCNGKGVLTSVLPQGGGDADLARECCQCFSTLRGSRLYPPDAPTAPTDTLTPPQCETIGRLRDALPDGVVLEHIQQHTPYHLRVALRTGPASATLSLFFNNKGALTNSRLEAADPTIAETFRGILSEIPGRA